MVASTALFQTQSVWRTFSDEQSKLMMLTLAGRKWGGREETTNITDCDSMWRNENDRDMRTRKREIRNHSDRIFLMKVFVWVSLSSHVSGST